MTIKERWTLAWRGMAGLTALIVAGTLISVTSGTVTRASADPIFPLPTGYACNFDKWHFRSASGENQHRAIVVGINYKRVSVVVPGCRHGKDHWHADFEGFTAAASDTNVEARFDAADMRDSQSGINYINWSMWVDNDTPVCCRMPDAYQLYHNTKWEAVSIKKGAKRGDVHFEGYLRMGSWKHRDYVGLVDRKVRLWSRQVGDTKWRQEGAAHFTGERGHVHGVVHHIDRARIYKLHYAGDGDTVDSESKEVRLTYP